MKVKLLYIIIFILMIFICFFWVSGYNNTVNYDLGKLNIRKDSSSCYIDDVVIIGENIHKLGLAYNNLNSLSWEYTPNIIYGTYVKKDTIIISNNTII